MLYFSYFSCELHAVPISSSLIGSPYVKRTIYEAPHYAVFFSIPPLLSSLFGPNILLSNQLSNTLINLCSSLSVTDQF